MPCVLDVVRATLWSEVCNTDSVAYQAYLTSAQAFVEYGCGISDIGGIDGTRNLTWCDGGGVDDDVCTVGADTGSGTARFRAMVGGNTAVSSSLGSKDHGNSGVGKVAACDASGGLPVGSTGSNVGGLPNVGDRQGLPVDGRREREKQYTTPDDGPVGSVGESSPVPIIREQVETGRGKNYTRNKRKRVQERNRKSQEWRNDANWRRVDGGGGCVSDESVAGTIHTVATRTAVEFEAAQTLAARRVVENELAIAQGKARLLGFSDKLKTEALAKLSAARMEQRINEAKAKSQASFKKCDESLRSLGSSGSAGEYALKQQVKDARQDRILLKYIEAQAALLAKHASPEVLAAVAAMPPPVFENEHDVFGECPSDYNEDEQFAYYRDLDRRQLEQNEACLSFSPF